MTMKATELFTHRTLSFNDSYSPWRPQWFPLVHVTPSYQFPILDSVYLKRVPTYSTSFVRSDDCKMHEASIIHGYVDDERLLRITSRPQRYLHNFSQHLAVIAPDYSVKRGMPRHDRIRSVFMNRALCAYFRDHGIDVIPSIRWAELDDLDFVLEGLPRQSTVAFSTQSLLDDHLLRFNLEEGMSVVLQQLVPDCIVLYGQMTERIRELTLSSRVIEIPSDISRIHQQESE